jgi:hypothetical protein
MFYCIVNMSCKNPYINAEIFALSKLFRCRWALAFDALSLLFALVLECDELTHAPGVRCGVVAGDAADSSKLKMRVDGCGVLLVLIVWSTYWLLPRIMEL